MANLVTSDTFETEVLQSELPVLVDFYADWCGPCKMVGPIVEQVATEVEGKAKVVKINIDDCQDIAMKYRVMSIPTLMFFKEGQVSAQIVGACPKATIYEKLEPLMQAAE